MSAFSREWLALREPADARARDRAAQYGLLRPLHAHLQDRPVRVLDLGCGTGANLRWLAPHLPARQHWRVLDHDAALLAQAPRCLARWAEARALGAAQRAHLGVVQSARLSVMRSAQLIVAQHGHGLRLGDTLEVDFEQQDLATALPDLCEVDLVTAAALLDLVSHAWLDALVAACAAQRTALLLALSYDGRIGCVPRHGDDARVRDALNRHQLHDKGFAPALGPRAAATAGASLQRAGYHVTQVRSDWCLTRADDGLHDALIGGWADAVREQAGADAHGWIERWRAWRLAHRGSLRVGHVELLALPAA